MKELQIKKTYAHGNFISDPICMYCRYADGDR